MQKSKGSWQSAMLGLSRGASASCKPLLPSVPLCLRERMVFPLAPLRPQSSALLKSAVWRCDE